MDRLAGLSTILLLLAATVAQAEIEHPQALVYHEDFESGDDPFQLGNTKGKFTIAFKGVTDEKAHSGKRSFKVDVTQVHGDVDDPDKRTSVYYWYIPLPKLPVVGEMSFSAWIYSDPGLIGGKHPARSTHDIGVRYATLPESIVRDACVRLGGYHGIPGREYKKGWKRIAGDVVRRVRAELGPEVARHVAEATDDNVSACVDGIYFMMAARPDEGGVIYIDDIRIEKKTTEQTPSLDAFQLESVRRWAPIKGFYEQKIEQWRESLRHSQQQLHRLSGLSGNAQRMKSIAKAIWERASHQAAAEEKRGFVSSQGRKTIDQSVQQIGQILARIESLSANETILKDVLVYTVNPINGVRILPDTRFIPGEVSTTLSLTACRGEYEPISFVVHALDDLTSLTIEPTELKSGEDVIDTAHVDIKFVKCWYQAGNTWDRASFIVSKKRQTLVSELLLNDDSMVHVDQQEKKNYLKVRFPTGDRYVWINDPDYDSGEPDIDTFPIKDSPTLLPADDIPRGTNKQVWVTVHVPTDAQPGDYTGQIRLSRPSSLRLGHDDVLAILTVKLRVLPFELSKTEIPSLYYGGLLVPKEKGRYHYKFKSEEQLRAELANLVAHGVTNPLCRQSPARDQEAVFRKVLAMRRDAGMTDPVLLLSGGRHAGTHTTDPDELAALQEEVRRVKRVAGEYGFEEVYFLGLDERKGKSLTNQRAAWTAIRAAGGKIVSTSTAPEAHIREMGDITDLLLSRPSFDDVGRLHALGGRVAPYTTFSGSENPERYRRDYGLSTWVSDIDGVCMWSYQNDAGFMWNDMDGRANASDMCVVYSTVDGVIDTIAWEGYREAIDDLRYLATLTRAIEKAARSGQKDRRQAAQNAYLFLVDLKNNPYLGDLEEIRSQVVEHILALHR